MGLGSSSSIGTTSAMHRRLGILTHCLYCSASVVKKQSKLEANPYRMYYRCSYAWDNKLSGDPHLFKWVEDAFLIEVARLSNELAGLSNDVKTMSTCMEEQVNFATLKAKREMYEKLEEVIGATKRKMKISMVCVCVISTLVGVGVVKWLA